MAADITPDPEVIRTRTAHGYQAFEKTAKGKQRVVQYLLDGDPRPLEGTRYADERMKVIGRLTAAERDGLGLSPKAKQREKKKPLLKPDPAKVALLDQAMADPNAHVEVFDGRKQKLLIAVDDENKVSFHMHCDPQEAVIILHGLLHTIIDADKEARGDLN